MKISTSDLINKYRSQLKAFGKSDHSNQDWIADFVRLLPAAGKREVYTLAQLKHDLLLNDVSIGS